MTQLPISAMEISPLITPVRVGLHELKHRVALSAMTRLRNAVGTDAPTSLNALYYAQRSNGGLALTECIAISEKARGYLRGGALYSKEQLAGWEQVVREAHAKGAVLVAQIFHPGRWSHASLLPPGCRPVAPSPVKPQGLLHVQGGKVPFEEPEELTVDGIKDIIQDFARAAKNAVDVGFDGIELHGGNGYLIQQFLAKKTNLRSDAYGGPIENRARFLLEVIDAVSAVIGSQKVGVKLQPGVVFTDLIEPEEDVLETLDYLATPLQQRNLMFVELSTCNGPMYSRFVGLDKPNCVTDLFKFFRERYNGTLVINGALDPQTAEEYVREGVADIASFGSLYIANANLPELIAAKATLNPGGQDVKVWYSRSPEHDAEGYTDWPLVTPTSA